VQSIGRWQNKEELVLAETLVNRPLCPIINLMALIVRVSRCENKGEGG
jgi:hypothetical protein